MIPLSNLSFAQGGQVKCRPKKKVMIKVSHSVVAEGTVCVWGGGGGGVQRLSGMTGISAISLWGGGVGGAKAVRHDRNFCNFFNLNNFTVCNKA